MNQAKQVKTFLQERGWFKGDVSCSFLAAGEYNENYLVKSSGKSYVFRVNHGTQLGLDNQIEYEYQVLEAVAASAVTPQPLRYSLDSDGLGNGVLLMEYCAGRPLDYRADIQAAAVIFARVHGLPPDPRLIVQADPVRDIGSESLGLLTRYTPRHFREVHARLLDYHAEIMDLAAAMQDMMDEEELCMVNTEVNSGNFLIGPERSWLVDWEKAVVSQRYQDLAHFLVPTTTRWKTDFSFSADHKKSFLRAYRQAAELQVSLDELLTKTEMMERVILLRALSWCYMAYHEYAGADRSLTHEQTFRTISSYLENASCFLSSTR